MALRQDSGEEDRPEAIRRVLEKSTSGSPTRLTKDAGRRGRAQYYAVRCNRKISEAGVGSRPAHSEQPPQKGWLPLIRPKILILKAFRLWSQRVPTPILDPLRHPLATNARIYSCTRRQYSRQSVSSAAPQEIDREKANWFVSLDNGDFLLVAIHPAPALTDRAVV